MIQISSVEKGQYFNAITEVHYFPAGLSNSSDVQHNGRSWSRQQHHCCLVFTCPSKQLPCPLGTLQLLILKRFASLLPLAWFRSIAEDIPKCKEWYLMRRRVLDCKIIDHVTRGGTKKLGQRKVRKHSQRSTTLRKLHSSKAGNLHSTTDAQIQDAKHHFRKDANINNTYYEHP